LKLAIFDVEPTALPILQKKFSDNAEVAAVSFSEPISAELADKNADAEIISIFVSSKLTAEIMAKFTNLKMVSLRSTGFDNIDLEYTTKNNIVVCNVPSYGENTVAEHAFMLLLALVRKLPASIAQVGAGKIDHNQLTGVDLCGKTIGVVGTGRIGKHSITIARGFNMNVLGFDPYPDKSLEGLIGFTYVQLDELLQKADFITIHAPLTNDNHHQFDSVAFSKMKQGAVIVNTSRGEIIDTKALLDALSSGHIGGAGLDVIEDENLLKTDDEISLLATNEPLRELSLLAEQAILEKMDNVILTPHNAFNTKEAVTRIWTTSLENIDKFLAGTPQNIVKPK